MPRYKSPEYGQTTMVAINIQSQLIESSFEHALNELIDTLDLSAFDALYRNDQSGASAYHPRVLLIADEAGLIGRQMFAVDGVKLPGNASKSWSGTREELARKAAKMDKAVAVLLAKSA